MPHLSDQSALGSHRAPDPSPMLSARCRAHPSSTLPQGEGGIFAIPPRLSITCHCQFNPARQGFASRIARTSALVAKSFASGMMGA